MKELNSLVLIMNKQNKYAFYAFRESSERGQSCGPTAQGREEK